MEKFFLPPGRPPILIHNFLRREGVSLTLWRKLKKYAVFHLDGQPAGWHSTVMPGQVLAVSFAAPLRVAPEAGRLDIKYEDDFLLILDKPSGLLVHPTAAQPAGTLLNYLAHYAAGKEDFAGLHCVSRLDRGTAGLLLVAKTARVKYLLQKTNIEKTYTALAAGRPPASLGIIDLPLARKPGSIIERAVSAGGKAACTHYKLLCCCGQYSLLEFKPVTGRTHQIRVHAATVGCPLLGDSLYGRPGAKTSHALCASGLRFRHPLTGHMLEVKSGLSFNV